MNSVFESAINVTKSGKIGSPKMLRINQTCYAGNMPHREAMQCCLYESVKLSANQFGDVEEIFAKSKSYSNTIISFKHKNRCISHIAINFTTVDCPPILHVEIAGDSGLLNFDSNKGFPVTLNTGGYSYWKADLAEMSEYAEKDNDQYTKELIANIISSIEQNSIIRR